MERKFKYLNFSPQKTNIQQNKLKTMAIKQT